MSRPRLDDDGQSVTLDLHGARVHQALDLTYALVAEAARRGRSTARLIHGTSTTDRGAERTIKTALYQAYDDGEFDGHVTGAVRLEGMLILSLAPARSPQSSRLQLSDLQ